MSGVGSSQNIPGTLGFFRPSVPTQDSSRALPATTLNFSSKYQALMVKLSFEYVFEFKEFKESKAKNMYQRYLFKEISNIYNKINQLAEKFKFIFGCFDEFQTHIIFSGKKLMPDQTLITEFRNFLYSIKLEDQETMYKTIEGCLLLLKCLHEDITDKKYNLKQPSIDKIHGYVKSLELILSCFVVKKPSSGDKFSSREDSDLETLKQKTHQECFFLMQSLYEEITDKKNLLKQACNDVGLPTYSLVQQYSGRIDLF